MSETARRAPFGLWSGVGMVVANMVGVGVFLSTGFMAQDMGPTAILLAWVTGAVLALCGARAYAEVARLVPRSGGEYRYLSELLHPAFGYVAGWASVLVGFSAPIAVDALAAGLFAQVLLPGIDGKWFGAALVALLTGVHALQLNASARFQDVLVALKSLLLIGFAVVGITAGSMSFPTWLPPTGPTELINQAFFSSLFFIVFAFSGWNAAIYASEEFRDPRRDVPRAMLIGCALVAVLYLVVNYIFVANLTPADGTVVFRYGSEPVTLGHAVMERLVGKVGATVMSGIIVLAFTSAMSAMILIGPRVYSAMAKDGFLPRILAAKEGNPPRWSVLFQGIIALVLVFTQSLKDVLTNVGAILTLFAALTMLGLFRARFFPRPGWEKPSITSLLAAAVFIVSAGFMLYKGFSGKLNYLAWAAAFSVVVVIAHTLINRYRKATPT